MFNYDFNLKHWNVIDRRQMNVSSPHVHKMLNRFSHDSSQESLIDINKMANQISEYMKNIRH
jgi:hypothetical protein